MNSPITGSANTRPMQSVLGIGYALLVSADDTAGAYELMQFVVPAGHGPLLHTHKNEDESFYIVDGEFEVLLGDQTLHAKPGDYIHLPRGVPHAFRNTTSKMGRFLCWVVPGNLGGFFAAFQRDWRPAQANPSPVDQDDIAKLMAAAAKYEIQIFAPS